MSQVVCGQLMAFRGFPPHGLWGSATLYPLHASESCYRSVARVPVLDLSPSEESLGVGLVKRRMAQVQDETVGKRVWEHDLVDLVGYLKKEKRYSSRLPDRAL